MTTSRGILWAIIVALLFIGTGLFQSWSLSLSILTYALIATIMAQGVNIQWGYAGLFNTGVVGFVALGGLAVVIGSATPVPEAWAAGGPRLIGALIFGAASIGVAMWLYRQSATWAHRGWALAVFLLISLVAFRLIFDPAVAAVESVNAALEGYLGGMGLPVVLTWPLGGLLAAAAAWAIGKTALGLRSDYLAIATLGIAEIVIAIIKNEDWLARGVKNVVSLPRPVPYEVDLQQAQWFLSWANAWGFDPVSGSSVVVKLCYIALFTAVLALIIWASELALKSPWGRMVRAIRDNEDAAAAMGKDVTRRHLQIFVIGSAVIGIAGAMMTTIDSQFTPTTYQPLRFTFLIWLMVIVGGSGNNWGALLGGFLIFWLWNQMEFFGPLMMEGITAFLPEGSEVQETLIKRAAHMRLLMMGVILLLVLRFSPRGLLPEK